jgi:hypothetical protein
MLEIAMKRLYFFLKILFIVASYVFYSPIDLRADSGVKICENRGTIKFFRGRCPRGFRALKLSGQYLDFNLARLPFNFMHTSEALLGSRLSGPRKVQLQFGITVWEEDDYGEPMGEKNNYPNFTRCKTWNLQVKLDNPIISIPDAEASRTFQLKGFRENNPSQVVPLTSVCEIAEGGSYCTASGSQNPPVDWFYLETDTPNRDVSLNYNYAYFYIACKP